MKEELLFAILFLGFRLLPASLLVADSRELPSPKAGAEPIDRGALALPVIDVPPPSLLPGTQSAEFRPSFGCSCILLWKPDLVLLFVSTLNKSGAVLFELNESNDILVPAVAGMGVVANGFGLIIGASDGWGGGVARCRSSLRTYVPSNMFSARFNALGATFTNNQLIFRPRRMRQDIIRFDHGRRLAICNSKIIGSLRRIPRRRW
jgi:hypothetical protein